MLQNLNDVPHPAGAIECGSWEHDGQRCVTFSRQSVTIDRGRDTEIDVVVGGVQDYTGAFQPCAWADGQGEFDSAESMRAYAAVVSAAADLWEQLLESQSHGQ